MSNMQRTNLKWDKYINYLIETIDESKFMRRAEIKPMSTPKAASESHLTSRAVHSRIVADVAKRLAEGLELNGDYIYAAMLMHDSGHPFSAHEGEVIFDTLGRVYNCGFYHHNAKGVEIIRSEEIMKKSIDKIPNINENPDLRKELEKEFDYFLDVIISHDGEATKSERRKKEEKYDSIQEAVKTKLTKANSYDDYKFVAQTPEGKLAKMADVIAYLATDIQDGFRIGTIQDFDDDYLELFGRMFTTGYTADREENINYAKKKIKEIKLEKLEQLKTDMEEIQDNEILKDVKEIIEKAEAEGIKISSITPENEANVKAILQETINKKRENEELLSEEDRQYLYADIETLNEFLDKMLCVHSDVVYEVTSRMKEYFINDILLNSQHSEIAQFSRKGEELFDRIKTLNYKKIVQYTKWDYQRDKQPEAAKELVEIASKSLIKSGAIRNCFYDRIIRNQISDDSIKYMKSKRIPEEEYIKYKEKIGIRTFKNSFVSPDKTYTVDSATNRKYELFRKMYDYVKKQKKYFSVKYENVYQAIPFTVSKNVERALDENPEEEELLKEFQKNADDNMKSKLIEKYGTLDEAKFYKEEFIKEQVEQERMNMEEKMAKQLAIDYISGMTDRAFNDLAIKIGYMKQEDLNLSKREKKASKSVTKLIEKNTLEEEMDGERE